MKRVTVPVPSAPLLIGLVFAILLALFTSSFTSSAATPASVQAVDPTVITGCVGSSNPGDSSLSLSGRAITASTLLRVDPSGTCSASESPLTWNVQGPQGIQGPPGTQGPQGPKGDPTFTHTYVITSTDDAVNNGNRLLSVMTTLSTTIQSPSYNYLVKLEPGIYDLGNNSLNLPFGVDLEGSGRLRSDIVSTAGSPSSLTRGVINMNLTSTVSDLAVSYHGTANYVAGIYVGSSNGVPLIRNVYMEIESRNFNAGEAYGIYITANPEVQIQDSIISTSGGDSATGIYNLGKVTVQNSQVFAYGRGRSNAIRANGSKTSIEQTTLLAQYAILNYALYVDATGSGTKVKNSTLTATNGYGANPHSTAIYNNSNDTTVQNSTLLAQDSQINSTTLAIDNLSTLKVGDSQVDGAVSNTGTIKCVASYNGNYDPIADVNACS